MLCDYIVDFLRCGDGIGDSPVLRGGSVVKNPPASAGDTGDMGSIPGLGRSPGIGNGNFSILPWKMPLTEEHGGLQSMGSQRVGHN